MTVLGLAAADVTNAEPVVAGDETPPHTVHHAMNASPLGSEFAELTP